MDFGKYAPARKTLPVRLWQGKQLQAPTSSGSPSTLTLNAPHSHWPVRVMKGSSLMIRSRGGESPRNGELTNAAVDANFLVGDPCSFIAGKVRHDCGDIARLTDPQRCALLEHLLEVFRQTAQHRGFNNSG